MGMVTGAPWSIGGGVRRNRAVRGSGDSAAIEP